MRRWRWPKGGRVRDGGRILVDQLVLNGVDTAFCVPGESFLPVLDALHDAPVRLVVCRQEGGAAHMAAAHGRLTGRPGVCLVTRGPGATNASVGVHNAAQDSAPMLLLVGQVPRELRGREAFQELDLQRVFAPMAKWAAEVQQAARLPELVARALTVAASGRPGPVVLGLPEDVLTDKAEVADARPADPLQAHPSPADLAALGELLAAASRPLLLAGGPGWTEAAAADLRAFAEANQLPVAVSFRSQDVVDNRSPSYAGPLGNNSDPALRARVEQADLVLALGPRLDELSMAGYRLLRPPRPRQRLVHVHQGVEQLGSVYQADLAIAAGAPAFARAARELDPVAAPAWADWAKAAREAYLSWSQPPPSDARLDLARVVSWLSRRLPDDAVITSGAGNYTGWVQRYYRYRRVGTQLAPKGGTMGYGLPAALAAKLAHPERVVVAFAGDGCFLMTGQELATAVQHDLRVVVVVLNNGMYGTIRMHQELAYPGRVVGTDLVNPDFAALASAFGAHGEVVEETAAFAPAFERALAAGRPALLELRTDPEAITPSATLKGLRAEAERRRRA
jgi:acetolactate synthase I/II/III large subunit